jgi:hypothetical protein
LLRSCAVCHGSAPAKEDQHTTSLQYRWFAPTDRLVPVDSEKHLTYLADAAAENDWIVVDSADRAELCGPRV